MTAWYCSTLRCPKNWEITYSEHDFPFCVACESEKRVAPDCLCGEPIPLRFAFEFIEIAKETTTCIKCERVLNVIFLNQRMSVKLLQLMRKVTQRLKTG